MSDTNTQLAELSDWIDAANAHRDAESVTWGRIAKIAEENGEVIEAFIGATGQNPRKGQTHEVADVVDELYDVAITALGAVAHLFGNNRSVNVIDGLAVRIEAVHHRAMAASRNEEPK